MRVKQSHPKFAVDFLNLAQEGRQRWTTRFINRLARALLFYPQLHSVIGRILADQIDFAPAFRDKAANFGKHRIDRSAAMFSAHLRDHAKTARMIATFGDFYIGRVRRRKAKARRVVIGNVTGARSDKVKIDIVIRAGVLEHPLDDWTELADLIQPDERVHLGKRLAELARETLRHASAHDQLLMASFL